MHSPLIVILIVHIDGPVLCISIFSKPNILQHVSATMAAEQFRHFCRDCGLANHTTTLKTGAATR
jgi:hypothetical protein